MISARTRTFALLGDPVSHSLSPRLQNAAFSAAGVDGVYVALRCARDDFPGVLRGLARAGGGGNVTVPHKALAMEVVEVPTAEVERTAACNTFWWEDGRIHGDNTDVEGFRTAAAALLGPVAGARVLVLGAGGAARAAVVALLDGRADAVALLNRTQQRAEALRERLDPGGRRVRVLPGGSLRREGFDLVVNCTSLGLEAEDPLPLDLGSLARVGAALDVVYGERDTAWVRHARSLEIPAADGREMLLQQGAAAFRRWWGREAPLEAMRRALG